MRHRKLYFIIENSTPMFDNTKINELLSKLEKALEHNPENEPLVKELDSFMTMLVRNLREVTAQNEDLRADYEVLSSTRYKPYFELRPADVQDLSDLLVLSQYPETKYSPIQKELVTQLNAKFSKMIPERHTIVSKIDNKIELNSSEMITVRENMLNGII